LLIPTVTLAKDFEINADAVYELKENGEVLATHEFEILNKTGDVYATNFKLSLNGITAKNITATENNAPLKVISNSSEGDFNIQINFEEGVVGAGKSRKFNLVFTDFTLINKTGDVWEIFIPKLSSLAFDSYIARVKIPNSFGEIAYISPEATDQRDGVDERILYFSEEVLEEAGISIAAGKAQVFSFNITYHLENPLLRSAKTEIALPPDTAYQKTFYESITPKPDIIQKDVDGNWIATYKLMSRERLDVKALGFVQIYSEPWKRDVVSQTYLQKLTEPSEFWQTRDSRIKALAEELEDPESIYEYVVRTLTYDYDKVSPTTERVGASGALTYPGSAICMEFTDLFITISRAAGIPAREVNGYAYTESPRLQPLSLVADVLHAWPEYWSQEKGFWVPVDPTWGNTTGGTDYFSKLDLRHFAFVIHGTSSTKPFPPGSYKLGANPQKDVYVSLSEFPDIKDEGLQLSLKKTGKAPFRGVGVSAELYNPGPKALYGLQINADFDGETLFKSELIDLLPFEQRQLELPVPYGLLGKDMPSNVSVRVNTETKSIDIDKNEYMIRDFLTITLSVFVIMVLSFLYLGNHKFWRK